MAEPEGLLLEVLERDRLAERAESVGAAFRAKLAGIRSPLVREVRGKGLLIIALKPDAEPAKHYCKNLMKEGVLCKDTVERVMRIAPPLVIEESDLDWAYERIARVLHG